MKNSTKIIQQFLNGFTEDVFGGGGKTWLGERAILQSTQPKKASLEASPMFHNIRIIVDSTNLLVRSKLSA